MYEARPGTPGSKRFSEKVGAALDGARNNWGVARLGFRMLRDEVSKSAKQALQDIKLKDTRARGFVIGEQHDIQGKLAPLLEKLAQVPHTDITPKLEDLEHAVGHQETLGLAISRWSSHITYVPVEGTAYHTYAMRARRRTHDSPRIQPYQNVHAEDVYRFVNGQYGLLWVGERVDETTIKWDQPRAIQPGDKAIIPVGKVHAFVNKSPVPFDYLLASSNPTVVPLSPLRRK